MATGEFVGDWISAVASSVESSERGASTLDIERLYQWAMGLKKEKEKAKKYEWDC